MAIRSSSLATTIVPVGGPPGLPGPKGKDGADGATTLANITDASNAFKALNAPDAASQRQAMGAQAKVYAQAGSAAINALIEEKLRGLWHIPPEFGTVGLGDDTAAITAAGATGAPVILFDQPYDVTNVAFPPNSRGLRGLGRNSCLLGGVGGENTGDIFSCIGTAGTAAGASWCFGIERIKIQSRVMRVSGAAARILYAYNFAFRDFLIGDMMDLYAGQIPTLFDGLCLYDYNGGVITGAQFWGGRNHAFRFGGKNPTGGFVWDGGGQIGQWLGRGMSCEGNGGGISLKSGNVVLCEIGLVGDTSYSGGAPTREAFIGSDMFFDTNRQIAIDLRDGSLFYLKSDGLWACSSGRNPDGSTVSGSPGVGLQISENPYPGFHADILGLYTYNNIGDGARILGGNVAVTGGRSRTNGGKGIKAGPKVSNLRFTNVISEYNTGTNWDIDPTLVANAKNGSGTLRFLGCESQGSATGDTAGLSGPSTGRYLVSACIGLPTS